jgi:peptidyl-prolyl cis-trans isomerase C
MTIHGPVPERPEDPVAVTVNGVDIHESAIAAETQHHPADSLEAARRNAALALVVRELLLQEADRLTVTAPNDNDGTRETEEEARIQALLAQEIDRPTADEQACRRYYENNRKRFRSPDLFEARHILFAASHEDETAYAEATQKAEATIEELRENSGRFGALARERSDCTSAKDGGSLGQVGLGDTVPEFETFLTNLEEGQLCPVPVRTRYGAHVLHLDRHIEGVELPYESAAESIAAYLEMETWKRAVHQYLQLLVGNASIEGMDLSGADSPLVQ